MEISLIRFLNINFLILIMFPYGKMFIQKATNEAATYASSFFSNAGFVIGYFFLCSPIFLDDLKSIPELKNLLYVLSGVVLSLGFEIVIIFLRIKKIKIYKITSPKKIYTLMYL